MNQLEVSFNEQRPNDKIVRFLSDKFLIGKAALINGGFDYEGMYGLINGKIYYFGYADSVSRNSIKLRIESMKPFDKQLTHYKNNQSKVIVIDNRDYISLYKELLNLF